MMKRREFITLLAGAAVGSLPAFAQGERMRRLGIFIGSAGDDPETKARLAVFREALEKLGWAEGRNLLIDYRSAAAEIDRMQPLARELVIRQPDLIFAQTTPVVAALQRETTTIPIVFVLASDPVGSGFVANLARPGGNITGFINVESSLGGKWLELLREVAPRLTRAALLFNPETAPYFDYYLQPFQTAARSYGMEPIPAPVHDDAEIERILAKLGERPGAGLTVMPDAFTGTLRNLEMIISYAAQYRVPAIYPYRYMVRGLASYGIDATDLFRRAPAYVDRILKGEKPAELPVQLPTKFEIGINLKTAKALDIEMSPILLARADEVIE